MGVCGRGVLEVVVGRGEGLAVGEFVEFCVGAGGEEGGVWECGGVRVECVFELGLDGGKARGGRWG